MNFADLVALVKDEPVFETALLLAGNANPADVRRQLSRWQKAGKIYQLRRGLYSLAPPFQKTIPHPSRGPGWNATGWTRRPFGWFSTGSPDGSTGRRLQKVTFHSGDLRRTVTNPLNEM